MTATQETAEAGWSDASASSSAAVMEAPGMQVLFTWRYKHGIDGQGRIQFPSRWKLRTSDLELIAVVMEHRASRQPYILVLPMDLFEVFSRPLRRGKFSDSMGQAYRHDYADRIMQLDLDGARRFSLPVDLREAAGLGKEALMVGCLDRFEIWNPETYEEARRADAVYLNGARDAERIEL
jgi:MraZ protein